MSKLLKTKVATAVAATLIFASAPSLAENLVPEGTLEELTFPEGKANLAFNAGPMQSNGTTQAWGQIGAGWCRFIDDTMTGKDGDWFRHSPAGNDTNVAYCNHKRNDDNGGIYRALENIELGKTYSVSGKGATRGSLQWAIEYTKQSEDVVTVVDMENVVASDLAWVTIEDSFTVPNDADLTKEFRVLIHTQPSEAYPSTDVILTERSLMWVDDYEVMLIPDPVEYFVQGELETITGFATSGWDIGSVKLDGDTALYVDTAEGNVAAYGNNGAGWVRYMDHNRTQLEGGRDTRAPDGYDGIYIYMNHKRTSHNDGVYREVVGIQPGENYSLSADGATIGTLVWAYSYTKVGEDTPTSVVLTNSIESASTWVTVTDTFTAPEDIDVEKSFKVYLRTVGNDEIPLVDTLESQMWVDNYSLMGPESLADTDEDGVPDSSDPFPEDPAASVDTDGDGMPDAYNEDCDTACQEASDLVIDDDDDDDGILDVNDGYPTDASQSVMIAFASDSALVVEGEEVTIDASPSVPNSETATYTWAQDSGLPVVLNPDGETVTFNAPTDITQIEKIVISLTVAGAADTVSDSYDVTVTNAPAAITPYATITGMLDRQGVVLAYGEKIQLDASTSFDNEDGMLSYTWKVTNGVSLEFSDATAVAPTFYVPLVKADTPTTIELTVTNYLRDYDGNYINEVGEFIEEGDEYVIASSNTYEILTTVKKTFPVVEFPLEYFPEGELETVTGFSTEGWSIGNYAFNGPNSIYLSKLDDEGEPIRAYGQTSTGWARLINENRTQAELGYDVRPPEGRKGVVAFYNHSRTAHSSGIYREVEGIVPEAKYTLSIEGASVDKLQLAYTYSKVGAEVNDNGVAEVTLVELNNQVESNLKWTEVAEDFVAPSDIDVTQPFKVFIHTVGDASAVLTNTDEARLWTDNYSLKEHPVGEDADGDSVIDLFDGFPNNPAIAADTDGDGLADDYVKTCIEECLSNASETIDDDDDNDGVLDIHDGHPKNSQRSVIVNAPITNVKAVESGLITLDAATSIPSADHATYTWSLVDEGESPAEGMGNKVSELGIVLMPSENGSSVSFTAPAELTEQADVEVMLTIDNGIEAVSQIYSVEITNAPSVITAYASFNSLIDAEATPLEGTILTVGDTVIVDASATVDSEDGDLSYQWSATNGFNNVIDFKEVLGNPAATTFTIPEINQETILVLELTVSNFERDYDGSYKLDEDGNKIEWVSVSKVLEATVVKTKQEKPDNGSLGFFAMLLLSGFTLVRRLFKK